MNSPNTQAINNRFIDCAWYGIDNGTYSFYRTGEDAEYAVGWSLTVEATGAGAPLAGASVSVYDGGGTLVATGTTDDVSNCCAGQTCSDELISDSDKFIVGLLPIPRAPQE